MRTNHTVQDRLQSLTSAPIKPHGTLAMADALLGGLAAIANGEKTTCTVDRHCRTRIFDYPRVRVTEPVPHETVYRSASIEATVVCDLVAYFEQSQSPHYALSAPLRHEVGEKRNELEAKRSGVCPYLVIEEINKLSPVVLDRGCASADEVGYRDGQRTLLLDGGRDNERFVLAFETSDGPWPDVPRNEHTINMILAVARACQDMDREIPKHVDQMGFVADDGRFVFPMSAGFFSGRLDTHKRLDADGFHDAVSRVRFAASCMRDALASEHIKLLVNALYWDDYKDDAFRRLHYLSLWQSFSESRRRLGHPSRNTPMAQDETVLAGSFSIADLTWYRDRIAHHRTDSIDENYLVGIYQTINELIRRRYFS